MEEPTPVPECSGCAALQALVSELRQQVEALTAQVRDLQERLNRDSANSSRPPSSDPPWKAKPHRHRPSGKQRGGQPGHPGQRRNAVPPDQVDERFEHVPTCCAHCHTVFPTGSLWEERTWVQQVVELPEIHPTVTEHVRRAGRCAACGRRTWAPLPPGVSPSGFGPRLHALVALLTGAGRMSRRAVQAFLRDACHLPLALGSISKIERRMAAALAPAIQEVTEAVRAAPVLYSDETRWREGKQRPWLWVAGTPSYCLLRILDQRDRESFETLVGADRAERTVVSDRYSVYSALPQERHGYCWAHLDRDFLAVAQSTDPLAFLGRYCLEEVDRLFRHWHAFRAGVLDRAGLGEAMHPVQVSLKTWLRWGAEAGGKKLSGFFRQLLEHWESLWVFLHVEGVEPTNNQAERLLRPGVRWRKTSYGTQGAAGRRYAERLLTVTGTLGLQQRSVFGFLFAACQAGLGRGAAPSLLPSPP